MNKIIKKMVVLVFVLILGVAGLSACIKEPKKPTGYIPTLKSVEAKRESSSYIDNNNILALEVKRDVDGRGQPIGDPKCEPVEITVHFFNADKLPIISLKVNNDTYTADNFTAAPDYSKITLIYRPKEISGEIEIMVFDIFYKIANTSRQINHISGNVIKARIAPTFSLTMDITNSNAPKEKAIQTREVDFMQAFSSVPIFYSDDQMSFEAVNSLGYCKEGYGFLGWFTAPKGQGEKINSKDVYEFYEDITLYAHYQPLYTYTVQEKEGEEYAVVSGLTPAGRDKYFLTVHRQIDGYPIKELGSGSMQSSKATAIVLTDTLEVIGNSAFANLKCSVVFGSNIREIGNRAFSGFTGFNNFQIPSSVKVIGDYAFQGCTWNTDISNLTKKSDTLIIPATVEKIGEGAFFGSGFVEVYFMKNSQITEIGKDTFASSKRLKTVGISAEIRSRRMAVKDTFDNLLTGSVFTIPEGAFNNCSLLSTVTLGEGLLTIGNNAFSKTVINNIHFPSSLEEVGNNAFANNPLTSITFEANSQLKRLGDYAFTGAKVFEVDINSELLEYYGAAPFYNSTTIRIIMLNPTIVPTFNGKGLQSNNIDYIKYLVPHNLLGDFRRFWELEYGNIRIYSRDNVIVTPGNNPLRFGYEEIAGEEGVKINFMWEERAEVVIPPDINGSPVTQIGKYITNQNVEKVTLPVTVKYIDDFAFYLCDKLSSVNFDELISLQTIGQQAFRGTAITSFASLAELKEIKYNAFHQSKIKSVTLVNGSDITIGNNAFSNCNDLELVVLGLGVKYVNSASFAYNPRLRDVYIFHEELITTSNNVNIGVFRGAGKEGTSDDSGNQGLRIYLRSQAVINLYKNDRTYLYYAYADNYEIWSNYPEFPQF